MLRSLARNHRIQWAIAGLVAVFIALRAVIEPGLLMSILNGVFAGAVVTIVAAYYRLIVAALRIDGEHDRVGQMTLGLFLLWMSVVVGVVVSIYARSTEYYTATYTASAVSRYIAIIAAFMQMRSLDYGFALLHGRDKKMLWTSIVLGAAVGVTAIVLQQW